MQPIKKIEIITDALEMQTVLTLLEAHGISGYTIIKDVTGKGERGVQAGDDLTDVFKNSYLLTTCPAEQVQEIVAAIRPLLKTRGGVCLISDAQWVVH